MVGKIMGAQRDFSFGEIDPQLKRADDHPARKAGLRTMSNARILNSGALQDRSGRRALYPFAIGGKRTERFAIASGSLFDIQFAAGSIKIINSAGAVAATFTLQGNGAALPWASTADINSIVLAVLNFSIYITFGHAMRPQVVTFNGVSTWTIADYNELVLGNQKRTPFYRISPQGIGMLPSGRTGSVTLTTTLPVFTLQHVGTRMRFVGRQMLITAFTDTQHVTALVEESLPGSQSLGIAIDPSQLFSVGDIVTGATSQSKGIVTNIIASPGEIDVQLITTNATQVTVAAGTFPGVDQQTVSFVTGETLVGPAGSVVLGVTSAIVNPTFAVALWDEEVMNSYRGFPGSVFVDQFRLGFCDFPVVPGGIAWTAINSPTDLYIGANPSDAIFEIAPRKVRVLYVIPGPEGSEFVLCDRAMWYIPISPTNPLKPGSVQFQLLSGDGCAQVQPRIAQEAVLYVNAGQNSVMAVIATGAYNRPFNTKNLCDYHAHLFNAIQCIAAPSADGTFNERYAYVLNGDGSIAVGKYTPESLATNAPVIGWGPWSGTGVVSWISAFAADVIFTSVYFGVAGIVEILDDTQYLDCGLPVNAAPTAFAPTGGKGPLWFIPSQSVSLIDQGTRTMGTYQIDANGFIVPQFNAGENLASASLVAGQPWTMIIEPFCPDAQPGNDVGQRMKKRRVPRFGAYVLHSTGFLLARLFSGPVTPTSPALGTVMNQHRFPTWNLGDDPIQPPPLRETMEFIRPLGRTFDPRVAVIKDAPGPLLIMELGIEATI